MSNDAGIVIGIDGHAVRLDGRITYDGLGAIDWWTIQTPGLRTTVAVRADEPHSELVRAVMDTLNRFYRRRKTDSPVGRKRAGR
jgi:hypothetical protein